MRIVSVSHNLVIKIISGQRSTFDTFSLDVMKSMFQTQKTQQERADIFKSIYKLYFKNLMQGYEIIKKHVTNVRENISWIDLENEPIMEFKKADTQKIETDKPIVTKEGITIYPDGTRVDRKGTIL